MTEHHDYTGPTPQHVYYMPDPKRGGMIAVTPDMHAAYKIGYDCGADDTRDELTFEQRNRTAAVARTGFVGWALVLVWGLVLGVNHWSGWMLVAAAVVAVVVLLRQVRQ